LAAIEVRPDDGFVVVAFAGELDVADAEWSDRIDDALRNGASRLVVDLTNVTFIDSSVIGPLVLAHRRVGPDGWLRLVYIHHLIARVIDICGLAETFPQYATVDAARRAAPTRAAAATLRAEAAGAAPIRRDGFSGEHDDGT
jgi:anti-anti-sigma factor